MKKGFPLWLAMSGATTVLIFLTVLWDPVLYEWSGNYRKYNVDYLYFCFSPFLAMFALLAVVASRASGGGNYGLFRVFMPILILAGMLYTVGALWQTECDGFNNIDSYLDNYLKCELGGVTIICMAPLILIGTIVSMVLAWDHYKGTRGSRRQPHPESG